MQKEIEEMDRVSYASVIGSSMYAIMHTRLDIGRVVVVVVRWFL